MKMTGIVRRLVPVVAMLVTFGAGAVPQNVLGLDDMSCAAWGRTKADPEQRASYLAWLRGFLSGHNYALPAQQVSTISSATIENHISRYCSTNPNGTVSDAAMRLSDQFSGRNQPVRK